MSTELEKFLSSLKGCLDTQHSARAKDCVVSIGTLVAGPEALTAAEVEYSLDTILNTPNGLLAFLRRAIKASGRFAKANEQIFDLFRRLIQQHATAVRKSAVAISRECVRFVQSSTASARERELATAVIQDLVVYRCLAEDMTQLVADLLTVFDQRKLTNRFQQALLELVGLLARDFPECVSEAHQAKILATMMSVAEGQLLEASYPSLISLAGALQGLNHFLVNFAPAASGGEGEETSGPDDVYRRIYVLVKKLSDWDEAVKERQAFRNALALLERHSALFGRFLYADHTYWQTVLAGKWIRSTVEDRKCGIYALAALHRELGRELLAREAGAGDGGDQEALVAVLSYFMKYFKGVLMASGSKPFEVRIAIRGFGAMSGACARLMSEEYMHELLLLVMQRTEYVYLVEDKSGEQLEHLPDLVQALSEIMGHVRELTGVQVSSLQNIVIGLIKDFHFLSTAHHELVVSSVMRTFDNLNKLGGGVLDGLLDKIILRGLVWSCSHTLVIDANQNRDESANWKDFVTYKNYLPLWRGLLAEGNTHSVDRAPLIKLIYAQLMKSLFLILDKLNLSTRKRTFKDESGEDRELFFCDPNVDLVPVKPKDFHIFFNLVDLYQDLLRYNAPVRDHFEDWIPVYFNYMVKMAQKHPLVSGFVKLIDLGLTTADHLQYFQNQQSSPKLATVNLLVYFLELQIAKSRHSIGELQLTCLRFVLSSPVILLESFLEDSSDLLEVFRIAFQVGKGILTLANVALGCVQRIVAHDSPIAPENRERVLVTILPLLDSYLQTRDSNVPAPITSQLTRFQRKRSVNLSSAKVEKIKLQHALASSESELVKFQRRILLFLGEIEPGLCTRMVHRGQEEGRSERPLVLWDLDSNCSIALQLLSAVGVRPIIKLDTIIARVCTLAVGSSDRRTKVAACELLHALVLYIIGIQYQDKMTKLWTELCGHLLQLATDPDLAICQMFEPLIFQIIHYLTQPSKINQKGTEVLASSLMESISHPGDTGVRDLAARCIREFLLWTIKQTPAGQQPTVSSSSVVNLSVILEQLRTYSMDSNPHRRQGAALAFNNIYRILREEESHIERSWLDLYYVYSMNYVMTEDFDSSASNLEQISSTIDHLVRVLVERNDLFNRHNPSRVVPSAFGGGLLKDLVLWLFGQCSSREESYRHKCMAVFPKLAKAVAGCSSDREFIQKNLSDQTILDICDHVNVVQGIANASTLQFIAEGKLSLIANIYLWLEYFISTLDMYCWLLKGSLLQNPSWFMENSNLFASIRFFISLVASATMFNLMLLVRPEFVDESQTSVEFRICVDKIIKFNLLKCTITVRIVDLLGWIMHQSYYCSVPENFWEHPEVATFMIDLIFEPQKLGFDFKSCQDTIAEYPKRIEHLLERVERFENLQFKEMVYEKISDKLTVTYQELSERLGRLLKLETIGLEDNNNAKGILTIAKRYEAFQTYFSLETKSSLRTISERILNTIFDALKEQRLGELFQVALTPSLKRFASVVLKIAFKFMSAQAMEPLNDLLLSKVELRLFQQSGCSVLHGEHFVSTFEEAVFEFVLDLFPISFEKLLQRFDEANFSVIVKLLCSFLEFNYRKKRCEISVLKTVTEAVLDKWTVILQRAQTLENKFAAVDLQLIELMSCVAMVSPNPLDQIGRKATGFQQWLLQLIDNVQVTLELKSKAVFLLPTLVGDTDFDSAPVSDALQKLQNQHFPLRSSEFAPSSVERISFENCIVGLLDAMVVSRSPVLLKAIINATAADGEHIAEAKIRSALGDYMKTQNSNQQCYNLKLIFSKFCDESLEPTIRLTVLKRFLISGLRMCNFEAISTFYKLNIKKINDMVRSNYGQFGSGWEAEQALINRFGGYQLIELYVAVLPRDVILCDDCPVAKALYGEGKTPGNKMITDLTKKAYASRSEVFLTPDSPTAELFRKYQCAAYRALAAIISNTKDDLQLYSVLLFRENNDKNEFIWRKLINCSESHLYDGFGQELEEYPKIKDKLVSIRRLRAASASNSNRFKYIQMTSVFESSLSQDVTKLDLNYSVVRTTQEASAAQADEFSQQLARKTCIALERSKINDHEVMATLCAVIQHMHENKITPTPEGDRVVPPPWIKFLAASLRDQQQHKNVRLFLAKVIDNCRGWLKPYAAALVPPLMQVIVDECITTQLNTFVTDLYALIIEWSDIFQPSSCDEISLASGLVRFLMRNCFHARREIFRLNLELVKNLIERWKAVVSVPVQLLYDMIGPAQDPESAQNLCGLQLNAIVMANGLVPWTETSKFDFIRAIFRCLDSEKAAVYRPASELLGMCLGHLYPSGAEKEDERYQNEFLAKLIAMKKRQEKKFMDVVYGIHKAFPAIVDSFLAVITHAIPTASGASKKIFLEMLLSRVEAYKEQVHRELVSLDLKGMLKERSYQLLALHLINKSLALMSAENLEDIIESVIQLTGNDQSDVRDVVYEIMIFIYENSLASLSDAAKQKLRKALLTGLTDADQTLQNRTFDFWTTQTRFPSEIDARFQRILEDLYEPSQEMNFLGYATHILLDTAVRNPESKRRIFQHEYEADVKLKEYTIDTHWRQRNSFASAPLFVESQQRFLLAGDGSQMERRIRATQFAHEANMFEPTQDPTTMTQTAASFTLPTQNSLLFEINPPVLDRRSKRVAAASSGGASPKSYDSLRRRILKDKERTSRDQALRAIERHSYEAVRKAESHKMKQGEVVLYRRYRIGDFPDLLINSLALLMPLKALCRRDPPLARQVFVAVFSGILDEWEQTERDAGEAIDAINTAIQKIFGETKSCDPNLFGALIEVAMMRPKQFDLKADSVATVASGANMMNMGVLYLENKLHEYDFPDQSIVSRGSSVTMEAIHWIKLAELYHGLNEYDVLGDIFSHKMDSDTRLREAIELESKGYFYKARELYHRMLMENQSRIAEQNFCFQSYYNCFEQMGMWEDLVPILEQQLDGSSEDFWTDEWNMENMLPKYVHANTRLNLSGDERGRGFITMLDAWMRVPDRKEHLKTNFGEEIAMLQLASGEYAKAKLYSDQVLLQFLEEWSYLDVLSDKLRVRKLLDIRKVSEVHTLGVLLGDPLQEKRIKKLVANWNSSHPTASDSPVIWDTLLAYRKFALNKLETQLEASTDDRLLRTNFVRQLTDALFATELRLLDASFEQNNLRFARKVIKRLDMVAEEQSERGFRWRIAQLKWRRISELENGNVPRMVANFKRTKGVVEDEGLQRYRAVRVEGLHELFRAGEDLREVLPRAPEANADELKRLLCYEGSDLGAALGSFSLDCLQKSIEIANTGLLDISDGQANETTLLADCHYRLAQFCYDGLEKEPLGETLNHERHLITSLLASMQYGSKPARQLFPVLLQLPNLQEGTLHQCFIDASGPVPEWMFLRWIPQLLSYVDFASDESFLESILLRLAASYPMALYYPAKFAHGEFKKRFPERTLGAFACKLMGLLEFPRLDRFVQELSQVVIPSMKVSNVATDLARKLSVRTDLTNEQYRTTVLGLMKEAFPESEVGIGREHAKLIPFKAEWMKLLGFSPESQNAEIWKCIEHIRKEMEKLVPKHSTLELRRYSPWLAEYHFNDREEMLELPGQYNVDFKPNVVNHVKIVKVRNQLEMFKTLRKPLRVQINGSDGRSYDFLVKYGEDLRQDQRIQQLLGTISNQMSLDQHCKEHQLSVRTYEVVPIRANFGIIGWIPNTSSIKSIAVRSMVRFNVAGDVTDTINREYTQFLLQTSGLTPDRRPGLPMLYGKTASSCTPEKIMLKFNELRYKIKEDALKRALFEMAVSPESFFNLRANFARSLMAMNVTCWILGIGDRHTSNVLIDRSSGRLAGVDFGIAFGAGARDQPIPEMVPFRLTPQFVSVMEPMRTAGLMHKCSVYTLACLRSSRKLLKSCLEVFVREPMLDWLEAARYRFQQDDQKAAFKWDPQTRINIAIRKLNGANPKVLVAEELHLGQVAQNPEYLAGYLKLLQMNVPNLAEGNLSVEQQVECLLQMATSGSILGIAYAGWFPWF